MKNLLVEEFKQMSLPLLRSKTRMSVIARKAAREVAEDKLGDAKQFAPGVKRKKPRVSTSTGESEHRVEVKAVELDNVFTGDTSQ